MKLKGKRILVTGGTGSLGQHIVKRLLSEDPSEITIFSRDEAKQHEMRLSHKKKKEATGEIIYQDHKSILSFCIGDVRNYSSVLQAVGKADIIVHTAALKQVPSCEYFPYEAVQTNIIGAQNIVRATQEHPVDLVVGISTDKACKPINVYGMTKAIQERILIRANIDSPTRYVCIRYGNVMLSRGSVMLLFKSQIAKGGPVTITTKDMTRFFLTLDQAVDTVFAVISGALPGEIYIPIVDSVRIVDLAEALINGRDIPIVYTGIRPGEKIHEILVSEEECNRTVVTDNYYIVRPALPELYMDILGPTLPGEYTSANKTLNAIQLKVVT